MFSWLRICRQRSLFVAIHNTISLRTYTRSVRIFPNEISEVSKEEQNVTENQKQLSEEQLIRSSNIAQEIRKCFKLRRIEKAIETYQSDEDVHRFSAGVNNLVINECARLGLVEHALQIIDNLESRQIEVNVKALERLLETCTTDAENGLRNAFLVWHKLRNHNLVEIKSFASLLKCIQNCNVGDIEKFNKAIDKVRQKHPPSDEIEDGIPNMMKKIPTSGSIIKLNSIKTPNDRLLLFGGFMNILDEMKARKITPTLEVFIDLLELMPSTNAAEEHLLRKMKIANVTADIVFYENLMKKRAMRNDYGAAKDVLYMMDESEMPRNNVVCGLLCLACKTSGEVYDAIQEMSDSGFTMSQNLIEGMLKNSTALKNYDVVLEILHIVRQQKLNVSKEFLDILNEFNENAFKTMQKKKTTKRDRNEFFRFSRELKQWLKDMKIYHLKPRYPKENEREAEKNTNTKQKQNEQ